MNKIIPSGQPPTTKNKPPRPQFTEVAPGVFEDVIGLLQGEAEFVLQMDKRVNKQVSDEMRQRIINIKTAICSGDKIQTIVARYRGQKGYSFSDVAAISAALSKFNGWENVNRYNRKSS